MGRKFANLDDLNDYLDHESLDDESDLLGEDDLAMIQVPKIAPPPEEKPKTRQRKRT